LIDRGQRKRHVSHQADVPQNLDRKLQRHPLGRVPVRLYAGEAQIAPAGPGSYGFPRVAGLARSSNLAPVQLLFSGSTSDSKIKQSGVAIPLASTTGADICAYPSGYRLRPPTCSTRTLKRREERLEWRAPPS
jgi:hypothetical protein